MNRSASVLNRGQLARFSRKLHETPSRTVITRDHDRGMQLPVTADSQPELELRALLLPPSQSAILAIEPGWFSPRLLTSLAAVPLFHRASSGTQ